MITLRIKTLRDNNVVRILATGTSGTIGAALLPALLQQGHLVTRLKTGDARGESEIHWEPLQPLDPRKVAGFDAVIHLAGENVFGRWTSRKRAAIRDSRVLGTKNLCAALALDLSRAKSGVLIAASAVGYYGSQSGDGRLTEESGPGEGFLAAVTREWEQATQPAARAGWRVINLRTGIVLSSHGGALAKMLPPFKLGVGGPAFWHPMNLEWGFATPDGRFWSYMTFSAADRSRA